MDNSQNDNDVDTSVTDTETNQPTNKASKLSYLDAFALLVSLQIGSGIFASPAQVHKHARAPGFAILLWVISGFAAWTGATCFAELGVAIPVNGGMQEYLRYIYGDSLAFMTAWIWIMAVKPASVAILSIIFSQYCINVIFGPSMPNDGWQAKLIALASFYLVTFFNMISINTSAKMMKFFTVIKILAIFTLLIFTLLNVGFNVHLGKGERNTDWYQRDWFGTTNPNWVPGVWNAISSGTIGIYAGLWAFSGWDNANMVAGDIQNPGRNLPRALHTAQPLVIIAFVLANVCYYLTVPWDKIEQTNTIAVFVGDVVFGWPGALSFSVLVSLACLGSLNVHVFTSSRLVVSAAQANWLPSSLGVYGSVYGTRTSKEPATQPLLDSPQGDSTTTAPSTPIRAMLFTVVVSSFYIVSGTFGPLLTLVGLGEYLFFSMTTVGLVVLRFREPDLPRPYKPVIIIPMIFIAISFYLVVVGAIQSPAPAIVLVVLLALGSLRKYTLKFIGRNQHSD